MLTDSNSWIKSLVQPMPSKTVLTRRVKGFDVDMLVNFALAQNVEGNTNIPLDAIGAPYRLATAKDGTVKFSQAGRPSIRIAKPIVAFGTMIHQNIVAGIMAETSRVFTEKEAEVKAMAEAASKVGAPIIAADEKLLATAEAALLKAAADAKAKADAEAGVAEAEKIVASKPRKAKKVSPPVETQTETPSDVPARELVGATA